MAIVTTDRMLGACGAVDCGAYIANLALAAYPAFWRKRLCLGEDRLVVCGISFGYEDAGHPANQFRTSRADISEAVGWVNV